MKTFARKFGIKKWKTSPDFEYMEAIMLILLNERSVDLRTTEEQFISVYEKLIPLHTLSNEEIKNLHASRDMYNLCFQLHEPKNNSRMIMKLVTHLLEGHRTEYISGSGATQAFRSRKAIYDHEGDIKASPVDDIFEMLDIEDVDPSRVVEAAIALAPDSEVITSENTTNIRIPGMNTDITMNTNESSMEFVVQRGFGYDLDVEEFQSLLQFPDSTDGDYTEFPNNRSQSVSIRPDGMLLTTVASSTMSPTLGEVSDVTQSLLSRSASHQIGNISSTSLLTSSSHQNVERSSVKKLRTSSKIVEVDTAILDMMMNAFKKSFELLERDKPFIQKILANVPELQAIVEEEGLTQPRRHERFRSIASKIGIQLDRRVTEYLMLETCIILLMQRKMSHLHVSLECFLDVFPEFNDQDEVEKNKLLNYRNTLVVALQLIPWANNNGHFLDLITRITEGCRNEEGSFKYVPGSGAKPATNRRIYIYKKLGELGASAQNGTKTSKECTHPSEKSSEISVSESISSTGMVLQRHPSLVELETRLARTYTRDSDVFFEVYAFFLNNTIWSSKYNTLLLLYFCFYNESTNYFYFRS